MMNNVNFFLKGLSVRYLTLILMAFTLGGCNEDDKSAVLGGGSNAGKSLVSGPNRFVRVSYRDEINVARSESLQALSDPDTKACIINPRDNNAASTIPGFSALIQRDQAVFLVEYSALAGTHNTPYLSLFDGIMKAQTGSALTSADTAGAQLSGVQVSFRGRDDVFGYESTDCRLLLLSHASLTDPTATGGTVLGVKLVATCPRLRSPSNGAILRSFRAELNCEVEVATPPSL